MSITIAVDTMGGDGAPGMVLAGVALAQKKFPDVHFLLFGDREKLKPLIQKHELTPENLTLCHADQVITNDMKPSSALRNARSSSMRLAIEAVSKGKASAVVSAGNTGAYMALSKIILKTLNGIDRPAIAKPMPTLKGQTLLLDLGANIECSPENLAQFALMGEVFARYVFKQKSPSIGLLNVGSEDLKGNATIQTTHRFLQQSSWIENFYGFVEGNDILKGTVDVVITDGFTGNVALKTAEGAFKLIQSRLRKSFQSSVINKLGYWFARPALTQFQISMDPRRLNGAPFLGLNGISVKSHGGTDAIGFSSALAVAIDMVVQNINNHIREGLSNSEVIEDSQTKDSKTPPTPPPLTLARRIVPPNSQPAHGAT
ncbi:MAG: phosphate acyltransferase PlsX [Pseudomonadota bacterium]